MKHQFVILASIALPKFVKKSQKIKKKEYDYKALV